MNDLEKQFSGKKVENMKLLIVIFIMMGLALMSCPSSAHFDDSWDWHNVTVNGTSQYKTNVHYCFDSSVTDQWKDWLREAAKNWNDGSTGWTLTENSTVPCQVTISLKDIPASDNSGGAYVEGFGSADSNGRISNLRMVFDTNLSDELWNGKAPDGWGRSGNNSLDPVVVGKHEFSHVIRMVHSGAGADTDDLEDPVTPGNHNHNLSQSDKDEAGKGITNRTARTSTGNITPPGGNRVFDRFSLHFREGSLYETASVLIRPLSHISTPEPANVPAGTDAIIIGVDIRTDPVIEVLEVPATMTVSYTDQDLAGAYYVGDRQRAQLGRVDESSLKAFSFDKETRQWNEILGSIVDTDAKTITFDTINLGFLGIGAKRLQVPGTQVITGIVREITHSESGGLSTVVVEDKAGEMQTVTVPISEGQRMKVGDEVEITIYTAEAEGVYNIGDILDGTITNLQNFVSEGGAGITMVIVMSPDGMEYLIAIPFVEGDLLSVGEQVQIPVTGVDGGELEGAGTLNAEGNMVTDVVDSEGPSEIDGTVTGIRHSSGRSILTIQDAEGAEHEVTVPLSEGEKIKIGVKVKVKILKSDDGTIESIDVSQAGQTPAFSAVLALAIVLLISLLFKKERK
jgi:hypothetical protein